MFIWSYVRPWTSRWRLSYLWPCLPLTKNFCFLHHWEIEKVHFQWERMRPAYGKKERGSKRASLRESMLVDKISPSPRDESWFMAVLFPSVSDWSRDELLTSSGQWDWTDACLGLSKKIFLSDRGVAHKKKGTFFSIPFLHTCDPIVWDHGLKPRPLSCTHVGSCCQQTRGGRIEGQTWHGSLMMWLNCGTNTGVPSFQLRVTANN